MSWRSLSLVFALGLTGCPPENPEDSDTDSGTEGDTDDTGTDTDAGTDAPGIDCHILPSTLPDWAGDIDPPSLVTPTAYTNDAGLGAVITAATAATDDSATVDLAVTGATVTILDFNRDRADGIVHWFWVEDVNGGIFVRLDFDDPGWDVKAGDIVNFTATGVRNFSGTLQLDALTSLTVVSSNNPVHVSESNGAALSVDDDAALVHHMYGELVSVGSECGTGSECFDFETEGDAGGAVSYTLRIRQDRLQTPLIQGDCVEIYAPMGTFSGQPQFNIGNFAWHRWYGNVDE